MKYSWIPFHLVTLLAGCAHAPAPASTLRVGSYGMELEMCSTGAKTCEESIECENKIRTKYPVRTRGPDNTVILTPRPLRDVKEGCK